MKIDSKCYVCGEPPIGHLRGMASCAACRKFITRHRYVSLATLRCEVGGPFANKCDLTRKRTCTKCRLRRSLELNPMLRLSIEKSMPSTASANELELAADRDAHSSTIGRLRSFLSHKRFDGSTASGSINSDFDDGRSSASADANITPSMMNLNYRDNLPLRAPAFMPQFALPRHQIANQMPTAFMTGGIVAANVNPRISVIVPKPSSAVVMEVGGEMKRDEANTALTISALNCIPQTYNVFASNFVTLFQVCTLDEYSQLLVLAASIVNTTAPLSAATMATSKPEEIFDALKTYSSLVMAANSVSRNAVLDLVQSNKFFAQLAKVPLGVLLNMARHPNIKTSDSN